MLSFICLFISQNFLLCVEPLPGALRHIVQLEPHSKMKGLITFVVLPLQGVRIKQDDTRLFSHYRPCCTKHRAILSGNRVGDEEKVCVCLLSSLSGALVGSEPLSWMVHHCVGVILFGI